MDLGVLLQLLLLLLPATSLLGLSRMEVGLLSARPASSLASLGCAGTRSSWMDSLCHRARSADADRQGGRGRPCAVGAKGWEAQLP